jgi:hypothetical protein
MNEMRVPQPEQVAAPPAPSRRADPLRRWIWVILVLFVVLFGWTLIADAATYRNRRRETISQGFSPRARGTTRRHIDHAPSRAAEDLLL